MTKRTQTLVTVGIAAAMFLVGAGISAYLSEASERNESRMLADRWSGSLDETTADGSVLETPEDDGCASISGREEWPKEMSEAVIGGSRPASASGTMPSGVASGGDDPAGTDPAVERTPVPQEPGGHEAAPSLGLGHDRDGGTGEITCPRTRDYSESECPEL